MTAEGAAAGGGVFCCLCCAALLSACSPVSRQLDDLTDSSKSQRCVDYQKLLPFMALRQKQAPAKWRADLMAAYELFLASNCAASFEEDPVPSAARDRAFD